MRNAPAAVQIIQMLRKLTMVILAVAVSGLVPLMANGGSCAEMPCCHHDGTVVSTAASDCCSPATCIKEEQAVRTATSAAQRHQAPLLIAIIPLRPAIAMHDPVLQQRVSWSPPASTAERLSVLSVLLI